MKRDFASVRRAIVSLGVASARPRRLPSAGLPIQPPLSAEEAVGFDYRLQSRTA